jgi:hypothetical protein
MQIKIKQTTEKTFTIEAESEKKALEMLGSKSIHYYEDLLENVEETTSFVVES